MADVVVFGYTVGDLFPTFYPAKNGFKDVFIPGKLVNIGKMEWSVGGAVSNTGIGLHRLGIDTSLIGRIGDDIIGGVVKKIIEERVGDHARLKVVEGAVTGYSVCIAVPGVDRQFLSCPGANDEHCADDLNPEDLKGAKIFHYGYPTLSKIMYDNDGDEMEKVFRRAKEFVPCTSLDMTLPDPEHESGKIDWKKYITRMAGCVDCFFPSIEELLYMMRNEFYWECKNKDEDILNSLTPDDLPGLGQELIDLGYAVIAIKCGSMGYYLKTAGKERLEKLGIFEDVEAWADKEMFSNIYMMDQVKSTVGAGDCSIAGLIAGMVRGYTPEQAVNTAVGTGAMCVTEYGATEGIIPLEEQEKLMGTKYQKATPAYEGSYWQYDEASKLYFKK